jgi:hypothetical protein
MAGELLASLGFTPSEIANLGGDAAVAAIEAQISGSAPVASRSTTQPVSRVTISPSSQVSGSVSTGSPVIQSNVPVSAGSSNIQQLSGSNVSETTNVTRIKPPEPKFKIGDWVSGTDDMPGQIKNAQWMEQEGLWRYRIVTHFGEDSWAERQLGSIPAQNISQAPTWGQGGTGIESITTPWPVQSNVGGGGGGYIKQSQPGSVLGETVSATDAPAKDEPLGPLDQFVRSTNLGSARDVMAEEDVLGEGPFTRYLRRRGVGQWPGPLPQGIPLGSRAGRHISGQFPEIMDLYEQMDAIRTATGQGTGVGGGLGFGIDEFAPVAGTVRERANLGASALQELFGMGEERRGTEGMAFENTFIDDEAENNLYNMKWLQDLVRRGTRLGQGRIGSKHIASRLPFLREQFDLRRGTPGTAATNFVDFFKSRYGL